MLDGPAESTIAAAPIVPLPVVPAEAAGTMVEIAPPPSAGLSPCSECGQLRAPEDLLAIAGRSVCAQCKPLFVQRLREMGLSAVRANYGGFWIRVAARMIDGILLWFVASLLALFFLLPAMRTARPDPFQILKGEGLMLLVQTIIAATYEIALTARFGGTIGKYALGLFVVTADGRPIGWAQSAGRYFATWITGMTFGIGYVLAAFDEQKRTLHDHVASTRVIRK
jgi:uncharacterized RDD family membrane protein YckC